MCAEGDFTLERFYLGSLSLFYINIHTTLEKHTFHLEQEMMSFTMVLGTWGVHSVVLDLLLRKILPPAQMRFASVTKAFIKIEE